MTPEERVLIDGLFDRMRDVQGQPRDAEAEALIARRVAEAPYAPYALAQTVLVQEHALQQAYARVQELEAQARELEARAAEEPRQDGGFLGGLFGGGRSSVPSAGSRAGYANAQRTMPDGQPDAPMGVPPGYGSAPGNPPAYGQTSGPWGAQPRAGFGGGGFLQGALATAVGVAGGALLFDGIKSMMAGGGGPVGQAVAAEMPPSSNAGTGDLGQEAQSALGGPAGADQHAAAIQDAGHEQNHEPGQDGGWGGDMDTADFDDGGGWDFGADDWT